MQDSYIAGPRKIIKEGIGSAFPFLDLDDLEHIDGNLAALVQKLQDKCGYSKEQAEVQVILFLRNIGIVR